MCGLLGLLAAPAGTGAGTVSDGVLGSALTSTAFTGALACAGHGGPDGPGTWHDRQAALGIARPGARGPNAPVRHADRYTVVLDGAVHNHPELRDELARRHRARFTTGDAAEVVAAAYHHWGPAAVGRLRGMFAFLVWDAREQVLFGARDPFGIKPLHVATGPGGVAFASEKKSLLRLAPPLGLVNPHTEVDPAALQHYLLMQYVPEPATLHRRVRRVESGTHFTVRPGGEVEYERYFAPTFHAGAAARPTALHARIAEVLRESVAVHMRGGGPVGAFLSGGVDSTAIAALAKEHDAGLVTFTAGFERPGYTEIDLAAETAAAIGVKHVVRSVQPEELTAALPRIISSLGDPVADPALVPLWFIAREAREHVKTVLSGEGADELFGGYAIYREPASLAPFEKLPGALRGLLGRASTRLPEGMRGKDLLRRGALPLERRYYGNARIFRDDQLAGVLRQYDPRRSHTDITAAHYAESAGWDPVSRMQHVDLFTWLRGDILVKADRATTANSLELRLPFLDPEVFAVASGLPREQKLGRRDGARGGTKYALRRALRGIVPDHVLHRPTLGFPVPIRHWLRAEIYPWACDVIRDSQADHLVDLGAVRRMLDAHREGPVDHSRRIWTLLVFLIWHGIVVEERIDPAP